jgi:hypothetical protein
LEAELQEPLENFDVVIVGQFNYCGGPNSFSRGMAELSLSFGGEVDCINIRPPRITQWAAVYKGAIVYLSMFSTGQRNETQVAWQDVQTLQKQHRPNKNDDSSAFGNSTTQSRVAFVDARRHIEVMGHEGASLYRTGVSDCVVQVEGEEDVYNATHRCIGSEGGWPDVTAWDLMEALYEVLGLS